MSLCDRCTYGLIYERTNGEATYHCLRAMHNLIVPADILRCSAFEDRRRAKLFDMEQIAWVVDASPNGRIKGFKPPPPQE